MNASETIPNVTPPQKEAGLTSTERSRRVIIVCVSFMRNLAYRRGAYEFIAGWSNPPLVPSASFWRTVTNNFLDICVLDFCKLFADRRGAHLWERVIVNQVGFKADLLQRLGMTSDAWEKFLEEMRRYRDKFVAHLDEDRIMFVPNMDQAKAAVVLLHDYVVNEASAGALSGLPNTTASLTAGFDQEQEIAAGIYREIVSKTHESKV